MKDFFAAGSALRGAAMRLPLALVFVALAAGCQSHRDAEDVAAAPAAAISQEIASEAAATFDAVAANYPALNATVRRGGVIVWEREGGVQRTAQDGVAADYNFYSTAKMLTGLAFARLEQERGFDLSQSVREIDPHLPEHYAPVTVRHLLSHTGGVRHYSGGPDWQGFSDRRCPTPADALPHFINDPLVAAPGERLQYSSYGFALLSHLLVQATGAADYDAAMRAALGAAYTARTDRQGADKAPAYLSSDGAFTPIAGLSAECKFGAGGLLASARDLALFGDALYQGRIVPRERIPSLFVVGETAGQPNPFVYGTVVRVENGTHVLGHSGGSPGGRSYLEVWVEPQVAVAITGNVEGPGLGALAAALGRLFAGAPAPPHRAYL